MQKILLTAILLALGATTIYAMEEQQAKTHPMEITAAHTDDNRQTDSRALSRAEKTIAKKRKQPTDQKRPKKRKKTPAASELYYEQDTETVDKQLEWDDLPNEIKLLIVSSVSSHNPRKTITALKNSEAVNHEFRDLVNASGSLDKSFADYINMCPKLALRSFIQACKSGDLSSVRRFRKNGIDVNADYNDQTALKIAAQHDKQEIVAYLIKKKAHLSAVCASRTPLLYACAKGHNEIIKQLVQTDALICNDEKARELLTQSLCGNKREVEELLNQGVPVDSHDQAGRTALMFATVSNNSNLVKLLITRGARLNSKDTNGDRPLIYAAQFGHVNIFEILIEHGAKLKKADRDSYGAANVAANAGHKEIIELCLKNGTKLPFEDFESDGHIAFRDAAKYGHKEVVEFLLAMGANINANTCYETPLTGAATYGHKDVVKLLIGKGANINATNDDFKTALIVAAEHGHSQIVKILVNNGADVNCKDKLGLTALDYTCANRDKKIVRMLLTIKNMINRRERLRDLAIARYQQLHKNNQIN
jgi:uncharacterized protein